MDLVDEKDYLTLAFDHFLHYTFETLLKLTLILCTGNQGTKVKGIDLPALQILRNITVHNLLSYTLRYRSLSYSRLTYKDRIILCPPA